MKKKLIEARELAMTSANAIADAAENEKRSMTEEEMTNLRAFHADIERLDGEITVAEKQESLRAASATKIPAVHGGNPAQAAADKKIIREFSIIKALRAAAGIEELSGAEKEMDTEARLEMKRSNIPVGKGVSVPAFAMDTRADEQVVTPPAQGGYTVQTSIAEVVSILRPNIAIRDAGATFLTGLNGNVAFPPQDTGAVATWKTEIAELDQGIQTYSDAVLTPKRLGAFTPISLQLLEQSSIAMQAFVTNDLSMAVGEALEKAIYNGSGIAPEPNGIIGQLPAGQILDQGAVGTELTFDDLVTLEALVANANAERGNLAYITNSAVRGSLKTERKDAGSGIMTWPTPVGSNILNGRPAFISNNMPDDLVLSTSSGLSAMIYGNWSDCLLGNWGGANFIVDPYTRATAGQVVIVVNTFWDILLRRIASFSAATAIITPQSTVA
jgi:HK97 family phage major capsid protein